MVNDIEHLTDRFGPAFSALQSELNAALSTSPARLAHVARYTAVILLLREVLLPGFKVLEIGFSDLLHRYIDTDIVQWDFVIPVVGNEPTSTPATLAGNNARIESSTKYELNVESDRIPVIGPTYDLIICAEIIQKMDFDPMAAMVELNRVHLTGGRLLMTAPNALSSRIVHKAITGYHPSFYMKYTKDGSPYRHNLEYTTSQLTDLVTGAGYKLDHCETLDVFEDAHPECLEILKNLGAPLVYRGDDIFLMATKIDGVINRYPESLYT